MQNCISICFLILLLSGPCINVTVYAAEEAKPVDHMFSPLQVYEWPEMAIVELDKSLNNIMPGKSQSLDESRIRLANLYRALGRYDKALTTLQSMAVEVAATEDLAWTAKVLWGLTWAEAHREKAEIMSEVASLAFAEHSAGSVTIFPLQHHVLRMAKEYRFRLTLQTLPLTRLLDDKEPQISAENLSEEIAQILLGLLRPGLLYKLKHREAETNQPYSLSLQQRKWLMQNRPWRNALVRSAEVLAGELHDLDLALFDPGEFVAAIRKNRNADLSAAHGRLNKAVALRQSALAVFRRHKRHDEMISALDGLADDLIAMGTLAALNRALLASEELIQLHERRIARLGPRGLGRYQAYKHRSFFRHKRLLLRLLSMQSNKAALAGSDIANRLILHADRTLMRPVRREIVLYRSMLQSGYRPKLVQALETSKQALSVARHSLSNARIEGRTRDEYHAKTFPEMVKTLNKAQDRDVILWKGAEPSQGKLMRMEVGPYANLQAAKSKARSLITTLGVPALGVMGANPELPSSWKQLTAGLTANEAIVTYIKFSHSEPLMAAVIRRKGKPRIVNLPGATFEKVQELVKTAVDQMGAGSSEATNTIGQLSKLLWHPLGDLPEHLMIVPEMILLGVPFEAFPEIDGKLVIETHNVCYALGLGNEIGKSEDKLPFGSSVVVGAYEFSSRKDLDQLEESKAEVAGVRQLLSQKGKRVRPEDPFPQKGNSWLMQDGPLDLLHVSTHAVWDNADPMFDVLVFPEEDVTALELALAPIQARLAVFSACNLFKLRTTVLNPVSGITTAALATVAPQVITSLWSVQPGASRLFMQIFYEYLLQEGDATAALAFTKRVFLHPVRLSKRMKNQNLTLPDGLDLDKVASLYYWAPFVVVIDSSSRHYMK